MDAHSTVTAEEGDRYSLEPPSNSSRFLRLFLFMQHLKLYIAVLDQVPTERVPLLVAHSVLGAHLQFTSCDDLSLTRDMLIAYNTWIEFSFRKVVLKVNQKEFDKILNIYGIHLGYENTTLEGKTSCIVLCPREEYPNVIKFAKLWTPNE